MEEDFKIFSENEIKEIEKYQIPYKWRDSCINELLGLKHCQEYYPYTKFVNCIGYSSTWQDCQFKRERTIISREDFKLVPEEIRRKSY